MGVDIASKFRKPWFFRVVVFQIVIAHFRVAVLHCFISRVNDGIAQIVYEFVTLSKLAMSQLELKMKQIDPSICGRTMVSAKLRTSF